ncbi:Glutaredoxin [Cucumispora dikerogammari]|nr:Glutaredoxin [Cucumispora dikerogammari]
MKLKDINTKKQIKLFSLFIFICFIIFSCYYITNNINNKKTDMGLIIYGKYYCPFTIKARKVLDKLHLKYKYVEGIDNPELLIQKQNQYKHFTVPLIILNGDFLGGSEVIDLLKPGNSIETLLSYVNIKKSKNSRKY